MALVAKSNRKLTLKNSQRGQISIFFSASLVVFVSVIAFVINVGLFVKAKINLQNATDASAFAGAAVQARQLTKIAYLNWEMRNIYKEWMYKYYVVGSLNTPMVENSSPGKSCGSSGGTCMDFRLESDIDTLAVPPRTTFDPYNLPAVCIHLSGSQTNICKRYAVPGLPEFGGYNIPGTEEASRSFIDVLIGEKVNDCVERSRLNMIVAATWAYNVVPDTAGTNTLAGQGPAILSDRQGAWPRAIELAMRIRNLEKVMNREAITTPVNIAEIPNYENAKIMGNERIVKAFYSGYRNLGNLSDNEMKDSFTLQELAPTKSGIQDKTSNSSILIPDDKLYEKQFVDLKLMMVNYATFYAALIPRSELDKSGACDISKVALPVPGYPLGFYKNPDFITYYAVKGEADFAGMFNPFSEDTIKLTAYAAAKPAGGRIGPMLFKQKPSEGSLKLREDAGKYRSVPYIASLDVVGTKNIFMTGGEVGAGKYGPGVPLPINLGTTPFWLAGPDSPIGGLAQGEPVQFGIPNLVYDFVSPGNMDSSTYSDSGSRLFTITPKLSQPSASAPPTYAGDKAVGLYNHDQFMKFKGAIGGVVSPQALSDQISRVRAATQYEAANYMIPTAHDFNITNGVDSFGMMGGPGQDAATVPGLKKYNVEIYAPLYKSNDQLDLLWTSSASVVTTIVQFMTAQEPGIKNYVHSLNAAAIQTYKTALNNSSVAAQGAINKFKDAAQNISEIDVTDTTAGFATTAFPSASCKSLASQFWHFYFGDPDFGFQKISDTAICPVTLVSLLKAFYAKAASDPDYSPTHYKMEYNYYPPNWTEPLKIYTAYMPGPYNGIGADGIFAPPFSGLQGETMRRNFYSTKLVTLNSLKRDGNFDETKRNFATYSEGVLNADSEDRKQRTYANPIDSPDINSIRH